MTRHLREYEAQLRAVEAELSTKLRRGRDGPGTIAVLRRTAEIMRSQLRSSPDSVLEFDRLPADRFGFSGAERWRLAMQQRASNELFPHLASDEASAQYRRKLQEYLELGERIVRSPDMRPRAIRDVRHGRSYLITPNPMIPEIMQIIASELLTWFRNYPVDRDFVRRGRYLQFSAEAGAGLFLQERPDMVMLLRLAQTLPSDVEVSEIPIERPLAVEVTEFAIGMVPIVGSIVAAYEAYAGEDLFGYHLTDAERAILGASVLLPMAGRLVKGGRALYSQSRLVRLYGRDAGDWSRLMRTSGTITANGTSRQAIEESEALIRARRGLNRTVGRQAVQALPDVVRGSAAVATTVDQPVQDLMRQLAQRYAILESLDEFAFLRILQKGPNVNHLKGQLLEELLESRLVPWLRDRAGSYALGIDTLGHQLEFIPGHLIRDLNGRQITDGILAFRNNGVLEIAAIFEAKAGRHAARELSMARGSMSSLTQAERAELRAYARDVWREQREVAQQAGQTFNRSIEDLEREIILSERGGQVRRDIERLAEDESGTLAQIRIGADTVPVRISPTRTKFFGVLPRDVSRSIMNRIERQLSAENVTYELLGIDISQRQLRDIAEEMVSLATTLAQ